MLSSCVCKKHQQKLIRLNITVSQTMCLQNLCMPQCTLASKIILYISIDMLMLTSVQWPNVEYRQIYVHEHTLPYWFELLMQGCWLFACESQVHSKHKYIITLSEKFNITKCESLLTQFKIFTLHYPSHL